MILEVNLGWKKGRADRACEVEKLASLIFKQKFTPS